jgi:hypothetical protein
MLSHHYHPTRITAGKCGWPVAPQLCLTCSVAPIQPCAGAPYVQRSWVRDWWLGEISCGLQKKSSEQGWRRWGQGVGANKSEQGLGWAMRREQEGTHGSGRRRWSVAWGKEAIRNSRITTATCQIKGTGLSWVGSTPNVMRRRLALQQPQHPLFWRLFSD